MLHFKKFEYRLPDSPWRLPDSPSRGVDNSPTRRVGELATPLLAESGSRRLSTRQVFLLNIQKPTSRLGESGSRFSITNISANSKPKAERLER
jgi:hypothetical protein